MNNNLKLGGDYHKTTKFVLHDQHKHDLLYLLIPITIASCIVVTIGLVGLIRLIAYLIK